MKQHEKLHGYVEIALRGTGREFRAASVLDSCFPPVCPIGGRFDAGETSMTGVFGGGDRVFL